MLIELLLVLFTFMIYGLQWVADMYYFTKEELVFSALNHDLGKMGDENKNHISLRLIIGDVKN
jgi:hypothetical protein